MILISLIISFKDYFDKIYRLTDIIITYCVEINNDLTKKKKNFVEKLKIKEWILEVICMVDYIFQQ